MTTDSSVKNTANGTNGVNGHSNGTNKTGVKVIVVGAGFGGLSAAIECHRHGHDVEIYESFKELKVLGDIITFGSNAGRIFSRWNNGEVAKKMRAISIDLRKHGFNIHKFDTGEIVLNQPTPEYDATAPYFNGHRGELHEIVFEHARDELKIPIHLGRRIENYFEDENESGIILDSGEKIAGDVVIAADGVRSKARKTVLGYEDKPKSSGYAVWRSWFSNKDMLADPETAKFCNNGDTFNGWIGPDMHFLFSTIKNGSDCCWVLTHPDEHDIDESWSFPGKLSEVKEAIKDWDPMCTRIVSKTPEEKLVDWKLVYRDPLPTWVSPKARILLLGDSAHPFLPTSAQGAAQAIEDGATIAVCLERGGKSGVPAAVKAHEKIRYDRVKAVQKTGETTRDNWHKTDWQKVKEKPQSIEFPREDWILEFDAEKHAEKVFDEVLAQA
ncbi:FAD/NAD(P)-binding domain-containing protein [Pleurostoma richardsiae]|uniref:FAD/NAD(P)-binding domain-containing protein n=1 Tax=Pleurostoma richardsiae TaxID=41990 RepID=A0AA38VNH2_9PEZI|nr:FAD/NAD(P)-binding domain-containing protein [Pleurostoma richardsiae]